MQAIRRSSERGHVQLDWLDSKHTFSFGHYHDPRFMGFSTLRVINEDVIVPGVGFPTHGHQDMEIITYMISGTLEHQDSMGNKELIRPGELQRMSAGTGVRHSEYNASQSEPAHLLQIWIEPGAKSIAPGYEQKLVRELVQPGKLGLIVAPEGQGGALTMHTDARLYAGLLDPEGTLEHKIPGGRSVWLHLVRGRIEVSGSVLETGDALAVRDEALLSITAQEASEFLLFDLP
ncbi:MAG: pirin family protein [Pelagibacteraceae bacterium]